MIVEDEKTINQLLDHLNKKIITYKENVKYKEYVPFMLKFSKEKIEPIMSEYLNKSPVDKDKETRFKNDILDFINILDSIFK